MSTTIKGIQQRGFLRAGVSLGINGLSYFDKLKSTWKGFDIDVARAVSVAILGDDKAIEWIPLQSGERFHALHNQLIDIGTFNATLSFSREVEYGLSFMEPLLYDGEVFMIRKNLLAQVGKLSNLKKPIVSAIKGSTTHQNLEIYFSNNQIEYEPIFSNTPDEALAVYEQEKCHLYCLDRILLAGERLRLQHPEEHIILPDVISREAMSPIVSNRDPNWVMAVKWILKSLIEAEVLGLSQDNILEKKNQAKGYIHQFLNPYPELCKKLGLVSHFTEKVISYIGNYADIYHRNIGELSPLNLPRGENNLRSNGGLLFSPLFL